MKPGIEKRLTDSIETVMKLSDGLMIVDVADGEPINFSQSFSCPTAGSVSRRWSREASPLIIRLAPARTVSVWDIRWNLTKTL